MNLEENEIPFNPYLEKLLEGIEQPKYTSYELEEIEENATTDECTKITYFDEDGIERRHDTIYPDGDVGTELNDEHRNTVFQAYSTFEVPKESIFYPAFSIMRRIFYILDDNARVVERIETITAFDIDKNVQASATSSFDGMGKKIK